MDAIALFAFLVIVAFLLNSGNWRVLFILVVAGIAGREALLHFEKLSGQFFTLVSAVSALAGALLAWLLCQLVLGPAKKRRHTTFKIGEDLPIDYSIGGQNELITERYARYDRESKLPDIHNESGINTTWPKV